MEKSMSDVRIFRIDDVLNRTGLSRPTVYRQVRAGTFPAPVKLSPRAVGWRSDEIEEWIEGREPVERAANGA
jgi:prophage regulatory protein